MALTFRKAIATVGIVVFACAASSASAGMATSGQFEQVTRHNMGGKTMVNVQLLKWSGSKVRVEGTNKKDKVVTIVNGKTMYRYSPDKKTAVAEEINISEKGPKSLMDSIVAMSKETIKTFKKTGSERVGGFQCDVYTLQQKMGNQNAVRKAWINKDPKFPITVKMQTTVGKNLMAMTIQHVKLGVKLPDSIFSLPKGTKLVKHPSTPMMNPHKGSAAPGSEGACPR